MAFPVSITGSLEIELPARGAEDVAKKIVFLLKTAKARSISLENQKIVFRGGIFRPVLGVNIITPIGWGEIHVSPTKTHLVLINYYLNMIELLVFVTVTLVVVPLLVTLLFASSWSDHLAQNFFRVLSPGGLAFGWIWLFVGNYLLTWWRFRAWLRSSLTTES